MPVETAHEWVRSMPSPKLTASTLTSADGLMVELGRIRDEGCGYNRGESQPSARTVAAPVFNHLRHVVAAAWASRAIAGATPTRSPTSRRP
ncbi:IclR family transcriptional regulator C-terminal domain-containing protein [Amycolatopsis sp. NPDC051372]|uniref:IclR family transcriptional regulator domain-containing protein n=1 Tax=unclassified Amycolatopsis TaxID=2618356 RepID=UPI003432EAFB